MQLAADSGVVSPQTVQPKVLTPQLHVLVKAYADALAHNDRAQATALREENSANTDFIAFADGFDRLRGDLPGT